MNPGPVEEAGKVAGGVIDAMKSQPWLLAMFVINLALLAFLWRVAEKVAETREREVKLLYDEQKQIQEILSRCVVPDRRGEMKLQSDESHLVELPPK